MTRLKRRKNLLIRASVVFELKNQGMTFDEIGELLEIAKQYASYLFHVAGGKLPPRVSLPIGLKRCPKCKNILKIECFYFDSSEKDGHMRYCSGCYKQMRKEYYLRHSDVVKRASKKSYERYPEKSRARSASNHFYPNAEKCSIEGCVEIGQRHHTDYTKPAEITWLCSKHHAIVHAN